MNPASLKKTFRGAAAAMKKPRDPLRAARLLSHLWQVAAKATVFLLSQ
jgi:hypothetical protein